MSRDWYRDHSLSPEAYSDEEYLDWAQDNGLYVDAAGNVDYGPPEQQWHDEDPLHWEDGWGWVEDR